MVKALSLLGIAAGAMAQSNGTLMTSFFLPDSFALTAVASVIGRNDTSTDMVTYLIKCAPSSLVSSFTSTPTITPSTMTSVEALLHPSDMAALLHTDCILPAEGATLVAGPSSASLSYNNMYMSVLTASMTFTHDCTLTSATASFATAASTAEADCKNSVLGKIVDVGSLNSRENVWYNGYDVADKMSPLLVTAGLEKLTTGPSTTAAASSTASGSVTSASGSATSASGSAASASSTGGAAAGRFDSATAASIGGATGILALALGL